MHTEDGDEYGVVRRSSHEERGLKSVQIEQKNVIFCRSSHEERGLKSVLSGMYFAIC